ncbi:methylated-DNA--[protein]-cysteine S-methyltransferase [Demequina sp. NBRC 110051]|uniref:methylated-DNA--[protein]-cysteine S-methyltransferase n=1 Tax=Demequina sp. NBRC 110051 TaxID=1570340 RepID=UPI000A008EA0|nr:methylated-DNA--[protein]-cysteine S-methyltransferase [Demequina sp. NBRC 110051]
MSAPVFVCEHSTPVGPLTVAVSAADGVVRAASFLPVEEAVRRFPRAVVQPGWAEHAQSQVADAVAGWISGDDSALMTLPVAQEGGAFTQEVWAQMRTVPAGRTVSYGELAEMAGRPRAARAVGTACAGNTVAALVPCHRVVQAGGRLGSYGFGGIENKAALLRLEGVEVSSATPAARLVERTA